MRGLSLQETTIQLETPEARSARVRAELTERLAKLADADGKNPFDRVGPEQLFQILESNPELSAALGQEAATDLENLARNVELGYDRRDGRELWRNILASLNAQEKTQFALLWLKDRNTAAHLIECLTIADDMVQGEFADLVRQTAPQLDLSIEDAGQLLRKAALLHDLGKIGVPDRVLKDPTRRGEMPAILAQHLQTHPEDTTTMQLVRADIQKRLGYGPEVTLDTRILQELTDKRKDAQGIPDVRDLVPATAIIEHSAPEDNEKALARQVLQAYGITLEQSFKQALDHQTRSQQLLKEARGWQAEKVGCLCGYHHPHERDDSQIPQELRPFTHLLRLIDWQSAVRMARAYKGAVPFDEVLSGLTKERAGDTDAEAQLTERWITYARAKLVKRTASTPGPSASQPNLALA